MPTKEIIDKIVNPKPEYAEELLERLGGARPPTEEEVIKTVEKGIFGTSLTSFC
jgi:hypothetical protein